MRTISLNEEQEFLVRKAVCEYLAKFIDEDIFIRMRDKNGDCAEVANMNRERITQLYQVLEQFKDYTK